MLVVLIQMPAVQLVLVSRAVPMPVRDRFQPPVKCRLPLRTSIRGRGRTIAPNPVGVVTGTMTVVARVAVVTAASLVVTIIVIVIVVMSTVRRRWWRWR